MSEQKPSKPLITVEAGSSSDFAEMVTTSIHEYMWELQYIVGTSPAFNSRAVNSCLTVESLL